MEYIGHISIAPIVPVAIYLIPVAIYLIPVAIYMPVSIYYLICEVLTCRRRFFFGKQTVSKILSNAYVIYWSYFYSSYSKWNILVIFL